MGRRFLLLTDNSGVKYLFIQLDINTSQERWLAFLNEFEFEVIHIKGKENKVPDTLSGRVNGLFQINISREKSNLEQRIRRTCINDKNYAKVMEKLQNITKNSDKPELSIDKKLRTGNTQETF
jgi:hypothetical protein